MLLKRYFSLLEYAAKGVFIYFHLLAEILRAHAAVSTVEQTACCCAGWFVAEWFVCFVSWAGFYSVVCVTAFSVGTIDRVDVAQKDDRNQRESSRFSKFVYQNNQTVNTYRSESLLLCFNPQPSHQNTNHWIRSRYDFTCWLPGLFHLPSSSPSKYSLMGNGAQLTPKNNCDP